LNAAPLERHLIRVSIHYRQWRQKFKKKTRKKKFLRVLWFRKEVKLKRLTLTASQKAPTAALRFILRRCSVPYIRLTPQDLSRNAGELFT
jgi:hypothetical protein